ncbi:MAG: protein kinase [Planctomycetota bacterium]
MALICTYCNAQGTERDQENGRCGNCSSFYTGAEAVVETKPVESVPAPAEQSNTSHSEPNASESTSTSAEVASEIDESLLIAESNSEDLVKPRRLSPHFKRRIGMAWQMGDGATAESTLSGRGSSSPSQPTSTLNTTSAMVDTKSAQTLSIATRRIASSEEKEGGDYELTEVIGEGSMGRVWSARQASLDRHVAVKIPRPELANAGSLGEGQFISEVVVTGKLEHPNIVPIYELGRDTKGIPFYAMKHVQGMAWNELIEDKSLHENLEILMKVCDAIAFAHDRNFLHRDIKPHNVMVGEFGEVSVMDWGIAVSIKEDPDQPWAALASGPAGTPAYMAPEMATHNSSELGVVSDVYLLGAVLYEIVTGLPPHPRTGEVQDALYAAAANEIVPTTESGELVDIARRAMATNVDDRYAGVPALQEALREYQSHRESIALCESANDHLAEAKRDNNSDQFARARFGYEEALKLWPDNTRAQSGLQIATLDYATNALELENYELGISILDADEPSHRDLLTKLEQKRASRKRLALFSKVAAGTAIAAVLSVVAVIVFKNQQLDRERQEAVAARNDAVLARNEAVDAQTKAITEAKRAREAEQQARKSRDAAVLAKFEARSAAQLARQEKRNAEIASYASDIGLAAESIRRNAFNKATSILARLAPKESADPSALSIRAKLRHIEWGLLQDASTPGPVQDLLSDQRIEAVASSTDGRTVAAGAKDGEVFLWRGGEAADKLSGRYETLRYGDQLNAIAISSDGRFLAAAGLVRSASTGMGRLAQDRSQFAVKVWDLTQDDLSEPTISLTGHTAEVLSVAFSRDASRVLSSGADRSAILWNRDSGQPLAIARDHLDRRVWTAAFSPNEQQIVTACDDGRVRVWGIAAGGSRLRKQYDLRGHEGPVYSAVFSHDGQSVISGGYDRRLLRWPLPSETNEQYGAASDLETRLRGGQTKSIVYEQIGQDFQQHEASIHAINTGSVAGKAYLLTCGNDNTIRVWNPARNSWRLEKVLRGHGRWVRGSTFSRSGETILSGAHDGAKWWRWQEYSMPRELFPIAERRFGKEPSELGMSAASQSVYSPDGRWVATSYINGTVAVWDLKTGERAASQLLVDGHALLTASGQFYNDGHRLLTSAGDNTTRLWNVKRGTQLTKLRGTGWRGAADVASVHSTETWVVTGSDDRLTPAWLWKITDGEEPQRIPLLTQSAEQYLAKQLEGPLTGSNPEEQIAKREQFQKQIPDVTAVKFAGDGQRFLVGDSSGRCFLFEFSEDGSAILTSRYNAHGSAIRSAEFLRGGDSFVTASVDGQVRLWDCDRSEMKQQLTWAGPVTSLAVSDDGRKILVGHAPLESTPSPIVELFELADGTAQKVAELLGVNANADRDWSASQPTVQSVQFCGEQAMVSLYFPAKKSARALTGYRLGYWDWRQPSKDFQAVQVPVRGEIAAAKVTQVGNEAGLLVVGGKGARLWTTSDPNASQFDTLKASFRPANSLTSVDFSIDPQTGASRRLAVGDREGNVRIWELDGTRWSESFGAATQLSGYHQHAIVATRWDPTSDGGLFTADRSGRWKNWTFSDDWGVTGQGMVSTLGAVQTANLSPDGSRVFLGGERGGMMLRRRAGSFESEDTLWQTGKVFTASFSSDGAWLATSDRQNSVSIWGVDGERVAKMKAEDAKGITTMTFTADRRRFVTGHDDKRVVIWDTNPLVDPSLYNESIDAKPIKELLTLEEHRRGVTSICLSPDGRNLLTAGEEGRTIVWSGEPIAPISIFNTRTQLSYEPNEGPVSIDATVVVADPSHLVSFDGAELIAELENASALESLALNASLDPLSDGSIEIVDGRDGKRLIGYRSFSNATPVIVGKIVSMSREAQRLEIRFNEQASPESVQAILRSLVYQASSVTGSDDPSIPIREVSSQGGEGSGNDVQATTRELNITLRGLNYESTSEASPSSLPASSLPEQIQSTITIELDEAATENKTQA